MIDVDITPEARADLLDILRYSRFRFGQPAAKRYHQLINAAFAALAEDPLRPGVLTAGRSLRLFHLRHVKRKANVSDPRHFVVFIQDRRGVRIIRLFHDAMDLPARLSDV